MYKAIYRGHIKDITLVTLRQLLQSSVFMPAMAAIACFSRIHVYVLMLVTNTFEHVDLSFSNSLNAQLLANDYQRWLFNSHSKGPEAGSIRRWQVRDFNKNPGIYHPSPCICDSYLVSTLQDQSSLAIYQLPWVCFGVSVSPSRLMDQLGSAF